MGMRPLGPHVIDRKVFHVGDSGWGRMIVSTVDLVTSMPFAIPTIRAHVDSPGTCPGQLAHLHGNVTTRLLAGSPLQWSRKRRYCQARMSVGQGELLATCPRRGATPSDRWRSRGDGRSDRVDAKPSSRCTMRVTRTTRPQSPRHRP